MRVNPNHNRNFAFGRRPPDTRDVIATSSQTTAVAYGERPERRLPPRGQRRRRRRQRRRRRRPEKKVVGESLMSIPNL